MDDVQQLQLLRDTDAALALRVQELKEKDIALMTVKLCDVDCDNKLVHRFINN